MNIRDIGEFGFIERFSKRHLQKLPFGYTGIGDDCAIVPNFAGEEYAVSTDLLVEDVHFIRKEIGGYDLGRKAMTVNLSDLSASGAKPCGAFLSLAIPTDIDLEYLDLLMDGIYSMAEKYECPILGGDTTKSRNGLIINIVVIGHCCENQHKTRKNSVAGDIICVTGTLGDSGAGLEFLLNPLLQRNDTALRLIHRHHCPTPRIEEGIFLGTKQCVHSMMDISDGISSDLQHILKNSHVSAIIELENLPISHDLNELYPYQDNKKRQYALNGGEDYELLLTVESQQWERLSEEYKKQFGQPLYAIGRITDNPNEEIIFTENKIPTNAFGNGWDHFAG